MQPFLPMLCGLLLSSALVAKERLLFAVSDTGKLAGVPRVVLKVAPLTLLELYNTAEVGAEVRLHDRLSIQAQLGYAPDWLARPPQESGQPTLYTDRDYWRMRLETRWYVGATHRGIKNQFPFGALPGR